MNSEKYSQLQKESNICKIKYHKKIIEYQQRVSHKMFCINKIKNTNSTEVYNCLHKPHYPTFTTSKY